MQRWQGWWRVVRADQWGVFFTGGILGLVLPALLYVTFLPRGTDIRGLGIAAALAQAAPGRPAAAVDTEGMVRALTDILWTGSDRLRAWRGGDVRRVYYSVLAVVVVWGLIALRLVQPIVLLQIGANVAGIVFIFTALHLLYINTKLLPVALRPPMWRRALLVFMSLFYGFFSVLSISSLL